MMVLRRLPVIIAGLCLAIGTQPLSGHHSEAAEYDLTQPVKVTGTLEKVEWKNPHVWFYVNVTDAHGKVAVWGFSTQPPGALMRRGLTKEALKIGAVVNVEGIRAKDGSNNAAMRRLTFADGTQVLTPPEGAR
jgi:hypothetical protein